MKRHWSNLREIQWFNFNHDLWPGFVNNRAIYWLRLLKCKIKKNEWIKFHISISSCDVYLKWNKFTKLDGCFMRFLFAFLHNRSWTGLWQLLVPTKEKECFLYYQNRPLYRLILQQHMFVLHSYSWISIKWKRRQNQCTIFFKTYMSLMLGRYWFTEVLPNHGIHLFWRRVYKEAFHSDDRDFS